MSQEQLIFRFNENYSEKIEYEDKMPEGMTEEDVQNEFGKVVYCEYTDCFWNKEYKTYRKHGELLMVIQIFNLFIQMRWYGIQYVLVQMK